MSKKAEQAALKAYPEKDALNKKATGHYDPNYPRRKAYQQGYEQAEKDLGWHSVKDSLPPIDEEVIVLTDDIHGKIVPGAHGICYGHIVDKNIAVDYDGWNIPGVTHWMPCPKFEKE